MTATIGAVRRSGGQLSATECQPCDSICVDSCVCHTSNKKDSANTSRAVTQTPRILGNRNPLQTVQIPERPLKASEAGTEIVMLRGVPHVFTTAHFQSVY